MLNQLTKARYDSLQAELVRLAKARREDRLAGKDWKITDSREQRYWAVKDELHLIERAGNPK